MSPHGNSESADVHQPSSTPSPISLASVLSATSYPIPEPCISESNTTQDAETCLYGGILLSSCQQPQGNNEIHSLDESPLYENATASLDSNTCQEEHQTNAKSSTPANAKRGRPRKIAKDLSGEELALVRCRPGVYNQYYSNPSNSYAASRIARPSGLTDTARKRVFQSLKLEYYSWRRPSRI